MTAVRKSRPVVHDPAQQRRRSLLGRWHLLAKEHGLDEDQRRDRLERTTGKRSAADCGPDELVAAIAELSGRARPHRKLADSPVAKKARALWLSLWNLGVVRDPSEAALEAFGARQLGVDRLQWADAAHADGLIEALKAMAERAGWSQRLTKRHAGREVLVLKQRLAVAQGVLLGVEDDGAGLVLHDPTLDRMIAERGAVIRGGGGGAR